MSEERRQELFTLLAANDIHPHPATGMTKLVQIAEENGINPDTAPAPAPATKESGKIMLHCGGKLVDREYMANVPLPEKTKTYSPLHHLDLLDMVTETALDLTGFNLRNEYIGAASEGRKMFFLLAFDGADDIGFAIGGRNSYDQSLSIGVSIGGNVFVCDNLALCGEITIVKKHTGDVIDKMHESVVTTLYRNKGNFEKILEDAERMKAVPITANDGFAFMGMLYGRDLFSPRQFTAATDEWRNPQHEVFREERNMWSLYNCCTETLKTTPPGRVMEAHRELHDIVTNQLPASPIIIDMGVANRQGEFSLA